MGLPRLDELLRYVSAEGRISPRPFALVRLRHLLGPDSPEPAVMAAWVLSSDSGKRRALERQLRFAAERGLLAEADRFLRALGEHEWYRDRFWNAPAWTDARGAMRRPGEQSTAPEAPQLPGPRAVPATP